MLEIKNLSSGYNGIDVVHNISFNIEEGNSIALIGPNGCGKSTILKAIGNIIDYKGEIKINNKDLKSLKRKDLAKKIALMSQTSNIFFDYTIYQTVALGRYPYMEGMFKSLSSKDNEIILKAIENVGLYKEKDKLIGELSGGQLQRVYLARVFAQEPDIILLDEPTNHLDLKCQIEILSYIKRWTKENKKTVIGVLHDLNLVQRFSERAILINDGKIIKNDKVEKVLKSDEIKEVYGLDIRQYMIDALKAWE